MIDDGYTIEWNGYQYRSLIGEGRTVVRQYVDNNGWEGLHSFLWKEPHLFGPWPKETDRTELFARMMEDTSVEDVENLLAGITLLLTDPLLGLRSCAACKDWWFNQETGLVVLDDEDKPKRRKSFVPLACEDTIGCAKGHHSEPLELSEKNQKAWSHFLEWRHVGLPESARNCPIVRRNWKLMGNLVEQHGLPDICK
ncbi:MAG: hypothetical protein GY826_14715 [Fuerstiella sp.]|nr:hypothetical protein [Fuerstiella sp.]